MLGCFSLNSFHALLLFKCRNNPHTPQHLAKTISSFSEGVQRFLLLVYVYKSLSDFLLQTSPCVITFQCLYSVLGRLPSWIWGKAFVAIKWNDFDKLCVTPSRDMEGIFNV